MFFYNLKSVDLLYNAFLLIILRFLVKRIFKQQFAESVKRSKFTTPTGIVLMIVHHTINESK